MNVEKIKEKREAHADRYCIAASVLFLCSIACDSVSALDPVLEQEDAPSSLRSTACILIACLASPPVLAGLAIEQRGVLVCLLVACAIGGAHRGAMGTRIADAAFAFLVGVATLLSMVSDASIPNDEWRKKTSSFEHEFGRRDGLCAFALSCLLYSSARVMRQAFAYAGEATELVVQLDGFASPGNTSLVVTAPSYSLCSVSSILALSIGGSCGLFLSLFLLATMTMRMFGSARSESDLLLIGGFVVFVSAFWATMSLADQHEQLTVLFGPSACSSSSCPASAHARRFALINGNPSALWSSSVGLFVLGIGVKKDESAKGAAGPSAVVGMLAMLCTLAAVCVIFVHATFEGAQNYVEISTIGCLAGILFAALYDSNLGGIVFAASVVFGEAMTVVENGLSGTLIYFTHCSIFSGTLLLILRIGVSVTAECVWQAADDAVVRVLDGVTAGLTVAGTSIFSLLFFASNALMVGYQGLLFGQETYYDGQDFGRTYVAVVMQHFLPLLVFLPLYHTNEVRSLATGWRVGVWLCSILVPLATWAVFLWTTSTSASSIDVYSWLDDLSFLAVGLLTTVVPWLALMLA